MKAGWTSDDRPLPATAILVLWGPILWALHQGTSYAAQSALCAWDRNPTILGADLVKLVIGGLTVLLPLAVGSLAMAFSPAIYRRLLEGRAGGPPRKGRSPPCASSGSWASWAWSGPG